MTTQKKSAGVSRQQWEEAHEFYDGKLKENPAMPKYNICMASLYAAKGNSKDADFHYKTALMVDPGNIMNRSDYALHLCRVGKGDQAKHEMIKAQIITEDQPTLHKNLGAIYARTGEFEKAEEHARQAVLINPDDSMNQRNMAKMLSLKGKTKEALEYNNRSVELDLKQGQRVRTNALRSAAVLTLVRGHGTESALERVREARLYDGVHYQSDTTARTEELKRNILSRKGASLAAKAEEDSVNDPVSDRARMATKKYTERLDGLDRF